MLKEDCFDANCSSISGYICTPCSYSGFCCQPVMWGLHTDSGESPLILIQLLWQQGEVFVLGFCWSFLVFLLFLWSAVWFVFSLFSTSFCLPWYCVSTMPPWWPGVVAEHHGQGSFTVGRDSALEGNYQLEECPSWEGFPRGSYLL